MFGSGLLDEKIVVLVPFEHELVEVVRVLPGQRMARTSSLADV